MSATIKEVAALSGVSVQTVSRAINHPESVAPETHDRVRVAAETLAWTPSPTARTPLPARHTLHSPREPIRDGLMGTPTDARPSRGVDRPLLSGIMNGWQTVSPDERRVMMSLGLPESHAQP